MSTPLPPRIYRNLTVKDVFVVNIFRNEGDERPDRTLDAEAASEERSESTATDLERAVQNAYAQGLEEGKTAMREELERVRRETEQRVRAELESQTQRAVALLQAAADAIANAQHEMQAKYLEQVVRVALAVARQVLDKELSLDPEAVLTIVKRCIAKAGGLPVLRVLVHPADQPVVCQALAHSNGPSIEVVGDERVERGGCIVETETGEVDGTVQTRWERVTEVLRDAMARHES